MKHEIIVVQTVTALHNWPAAPGRRSYLRTPHRHDFEVRVWIQVGHGDRDIEFHDAQDALKEILEGLGFINGSVIDYSSRSCEDIGENVLDHIWNATKVQVFEDGRCGAEVTRSCKEDPSLTVEEMDRPEIVTICGSTRFKQEHLDAMKRLEDAGKAAFMVGSFMHADSLFEVSNAMKEGYDRLHLQKIALSDSIYVVNVGGYVGMSTAREISYAKELGKRIEYLEDRGV